jgi:hypothetical protein
VFAAPKAFHATPYFTHTIQRPPRGRLSSGQPEEAPRQALPRTRRTDSGQRLERIARPFRLKWLTTGKVTGTLNSCSLIAGALLLMAPFGLIPFSNTLPALALLLLAIGFLQRDGVCILLGHLVNVATIIYFGFLIAGGGVLI